MNSLKSRFFVKTMGRARARILYVILALIIMVLGLLIILNAT